MKQTDREALSYIQGGLEMLRSFFNKQNEDYQAINDELCVYYNLIKDILSEKDGDSK